MLKTYIKFIFTNKLILLLLISFCLCFSLQSVTDKITNKSHQGEIICFVHFLFCCVLSDKLKRGKWSVLRKWCHRGRTQHGNLPQDGSFSEQGLH